MINQAKKDKERKKEDEQRYNKLRKGIEKSFEAGSGNFIKLNMLHDQPRGLQSLMSEHDIKQLALLFLSLNDNELQSTIQTLQDVYHAITNDQVVRFIYLSDRNSP